MYNQSTTIKVLLLDPLPTATVNAFLAANATGASYEIVEHFRECSEGDLVKLIQVYQVVCLSREGIDAPVLTDEVLRSAHRLLAIGVFGSLSNQVDNATAQSLGIPVFTAPYQHQTSVAELVISQIVLLSRQIGDRSKEIHTGLWSKVTEKNT